MGHLGGTLLIALACAACNPFGDREYACTSDSQCGASGKCASGFCSAADPSCASGFRYGNAAGTLSNVCVGDGAEHDGGLTIDAKEYKDAPPPGVQCFGMGFGKTCFMDADVPTAAVTINTNIDTGTDPMCSTKVMNNPPWCVIAGTSVTVSGNANITGSKPLVLVAVAGEVDVNATLDAASHINGQNGAANASGADCDAGMDPDNGAGAGGSYGAKGGTGGNGDAMHGQPGNTKPADMRGGCAGQNGKGGTPGNGGLGGGAVYLIATSKIVVTGAINASGSGGHKASNNGSAGGAGSGGLIGLDSPIVTNTNGVIFANGGGGGEGANNQFGGNDGNDSNNGNKANGGSGGTNNGGDGGDGGYDMTAAENGKNGNSGAGGGGGGGGVGYVKLFQATTITGGTVSPPAN
ncbi:MAG: hypothetical protein QM831_18425 [Kofleriaceae bacterium]